MLELQHDNLVFTAPGVHQDARVTISLERTLRIPDDGREHRLPPSLGHFPVRHVDDYKDRIPERWVKHGGVMIPIFQSEALWLSFKAGYSHDHEAPYPFAIKVGAGKRSAITGRVWSKSLREKDYCVVPEQPWLDGFVVEEGKVRQFVAMPLGMGLTVEAQLSGKEEFGGLQIEVIPMKREVFEKNWPKRPHYSSFERYSLVGEEECYGAIACAAAPACAAGFDMGLGAGGMMRQQVFEDPYRMEDWDTENSTRCYIHLANSLAWRAITKQEPPTIPPTAADYSRAGLRWYDHYRDDLKALAATGKMAAIKSILQLGFQKGLHGVIPENEPVEPKVVIDTSPRRPNEVRDGVWK